ncbi:MAG: hypothetical protein H6839_08780 [Planctomycetes bacterium]|nr:hypothetical protein [Planctomycetota bacterium]
MTRLFAILLVLLFAVPLCAQAPKDGDNKDEKKDEKKEEKPEADDLGIPADFTAYLKKRFPQLDPGGEHDLFNLKDYKDADKRHEYTVAMTQLLIIYMSELGMGSTVAKQFDQYARGKEGNQVTFKVLYAVVLMYYPPGQPNTTEAEKLLREATEAAPNYAYPWFLLANFEFARFTQIDGTSPRPVLQALEKALTIRPNFLRAILLKSQVYLSATPPRAADVREMIEPFVTTKLAASGDDFEDTLKLYAACHKLDEFVALIKSLVDSGKLSNVQKVRAYQQLCRLRTDMKQWDEAIDDLERMLQWIDPESDPDAALMAHTRLAMCWGTKAMDLRAANKDTSDPKVKQDIETYIAAAQSEHQLCVEIELKYLPLALRGLQARQYVQFLYGTQGAEPARDWLKSYLGDNDLTSSQRNVLENLLSLLEIELNPTEDGLINLYENYVSQDDMEKLGASLAMAKENISLKGSARFRKERSLKFFVSQLSNRVRQIVGIDAWLVADTAVNYVKDMQLAADEARQNAEAARKNADAAAEEGGEKAKLAQEVLKKANEKSKLANEELESAKKALADAASAIADRLEKETELKSEAQAELQEALSKALIQIGDLAAQERGARNESKLILAAKEDKEIRGLMKGLAAVWSDKEFLDKLKNKPPKISRTDLFSPEKTGNWLEKLADSIKKDIEDAKQPAKDD